MENILLYGLGQWFENRVDILREKFNIVGVSDKDSQKHTVANRYGLKFYPIDEIPLVKYDYLFIALKDVDDAIAFLLSNIPLKPKQIIDGCMWWGEYKKQEVIIRHFGEDNPDVRFLLIRRTNEQVGLFSNFLVFMQHIRIALVKGYIPVIDMKNYPNAYLEDTKLGKENSWEYYFKQPSSLYSLDEVYHSSFVELCRDEGVPDTQYAYDKVIKNLYIRHIYHDIYCNYMCVSDIILQETIHIRDKLFGKYQKNRKKICGVLLRGTDYLKFKPYGHPVQPNIEQAIKKIRQLINDWGIDYLYFSSEDNEILQKMKSEFGEMYLEYDCPRFTMRDDETYVDKLSLTPYHEFKRENDCYLKGKEYLISMLLMTYCDSFIAGNVSGTIGVLVMKEKFEHEYVFDLGNYGIDEDSYIYTPSGKPIFKKQ